MRLSGSHTRMRHGGLYDSKYPPARGARSRNPPGDVRFALGLIGTLGAREAEGFHRHGPQQVSLGLVQRHIATLRLSFRPRRFGAARGTRAVSLLAVEFGQKLGVAGGRERGGGLDFESGGWSDQAELEREHKTGEWMAYARPAFAP